MTRRSGLALAAIDLLGSLFLVALVQMAPPPRPAVLRTQGEYAIVLTWAEDCLADLDLYVRQPSGEIVYFNHLNGSTVHLEHDDIPSIGLGYQGQQNFERAVLRGISPGEYTVNVHVYQAGGCRLPIGATVELWRLRGDEQTAFRFSLRRGGTTYGLNRLPRSLVEAPK
jgi:hypothetical protein